MKRVKMDIEDGAKKLREAQATREKRAKVNQEKASKKAEASAQRLAKAKAKASTAAERAAAKKGALPVAGKARFAIFHMNFNVPRCEEFTLPDASLSSAESVRILQAAHKAFDEDGPVVLHVRAPVQPLHGNIALALKDFERDLVRPGVLGTGSQSRNGRALKCRSDIAAAAELLQVGMPHALCSLAVALPRAATSGKTCIHTHR